ncbi:hypothetical protein CRENBAI_003011 [Crenichthys baileyi]|uniref:Uncharacterized protein n=1 Tax=Crenichthys baileyi TaxID=28760 RepID=A0AAV9S8N3_9TELE
MKRFSRRIDTLLRCPNKKCEKRFNEAQMGNSFICPPNGNPLKDKIQLKPAMRRVKKTRGNEMSTSRSRRTPVICRKIQNNLQSRSCVTEMDKKLSTGSWWTALWHGALKMGKTTWNQQKKQAVQQYKASFVAMQKGQMVTVNISSPALDLPSGGVHRSACVSRVASHSCCVTISTNSPVPLPTSETFLCKTLHCQLRELRDAASGPSRREQTSCKHDSEMASISGLSR